MLGKGCSLTRSAVLRIHLMHADDSSRARGPGRQALLGLGALIALGALLRILGLGQQSLWVDEAFSILYAKPDVPLRVEYLLDNLHGPLHAFVLHHWIQIAGMSEAMLRVPSLIASLLTLPFFWLLAREVWNERIAWCGTLLLAVSPFHVWYAQEVRNYAFLMLFAVLAEWAFRRLLARGPQGGRLAAYGLALLAGFFSNLSMLFLVLAQALRLLLLIRPVNRQLWLRILGVWILVALCLTPWAIRFYQRQVAPSQLLTTEAVPAAEKLRQETTDTILGVPYTFYAFATGYSLGPSRRDLWTAGPVAAVRQYWPPIAIAALVFGLLWITGLVRRWRENPREALALIIWQLVPLIVLLYIANRNVKVINPRYVAVAFPAFVALIAAGVSRRRISQILFGAALALSLFSVGRALTMPAYHKENYRGAAQYLQTTMGPGDLYLSLAVDQPMRYVYLRDALRGDPPPPWEYLGKLVTWGSLVAIKGEGPGSYEDIVLRRWQPGHRLFVFLAREWVPDPQGALEADLRRRGRVIAEKYWTGSRVLVLERLEDDVTRTGGRHADHQTPVTEDADSPGGADPVTEEGTP